MLRWVRVGLSGSTVLRDRIRGRERTRRDGGGSISRIKAAVVIVLMQSAKA